MFGPRKTSYDGSLGSHSPMGMSLTFFHRFNDSHCGRRSGPEPLKPFCIVSGKRM